MPNACSRRRLPLRRIGWLALLPVAFAACQPKADSSESAPAGDAAPPANQHEEIREITATVQTPTAGWDLELLSAHRVNGEYWTIFRLVPPPGMAAQVISEISETARFAGPDLPTRRFVLGKTWDWNSNSNSDIEFIESVDPLTDDLADAEPLTLIPD